VCIRLATYEDRREADYLRAIFAGRGNTLENTVFLLMTPDGKTRLTPGGRTPDWVWEDASAMAQGMKAIAARYRPGGEIRGVPCMATFRLSLNVAACDSLPLLAAVGAKGEDAAVAAKSLEAIAWAEGLRGRIAFAPPTSIADLAATGIRVDKPGIYFIEPETYGMTGTAKGSVALDAETDAVREFAKAQLGRFVVPVKSERSHIGQGRAKASDRDAPRGSSGRQRSRSRTPTGGGAEASRTGGSTSGPCASRPSRRRGSRSSRGPSPESATCPSRA